MVTHSVAVHSWRSLILSFRLLCCTSHETNTVQRDHTLTRNRQFHNRIIICSPPGRHSNVSSSSSVANVRTSCDADERIATFVSLNTFRYHNFSPSQIINFAWTPVLSLRPMHCRGGTFDKRRPVLLYPISILTFLLPSPMVTMPAARASSLFRGVLFCPPLRSEEYFLTAHFLVRQGLCEFSVFLKTFCLHFLHHF